MSKLDDLKKINKPLDKAIGVIAGLGVPGLILLTATKAAGAAGLVGGAGLIAGLVGTGPGGIVLGIGTLGALALISKWGAEEIVFSRSLQRLKRKGLTEAQIIEKINNSRLVSHSLKQKLIQNIKSHKGE